MARPLALAAALAVSLLAVSGAGGAPAQTPKRGGTVVVAMNSLAEPTCLGWAPACLGRWEWRDKVLALPFRQGPYGLRGDVVARYSLTRDPFTVTFHIRPQARWSDGAPIVARDFAFAYHTYRAQWRDYAPELRTVIRRVDTVDAKTVRFVFRSRYGDWKLLLQFPPLPRHALRGMDLAASEDFWRGGIVDPRTGRAIGSGPFLVGPWERGKQLTLVRNPRYWGSHKAYVDRIVLRFVRGLTADVEQALRSGEVDLGIVAAPPRDLQPHPGFELHTTTWSNWEHFELRVGPGGHPALRDKRVRRALANGIDRVELARSLFGDIPVLDNTIYLTSERNYRPNWSMYRYRPATARRLLEQAGCRRGPDGVYACAGERLRLRFITTAGVSQRQRVLELAAAQLRRVGVEVQPVYVPNIALFDAVLPNGDFDVALFSFGKSAPDQAFTPYRCGAGFNPSGYCSRLLTADVDQLDRIVDPARRAVVANRVDRRLAADVPTLPLYQFPLTYIVRRGLQGVAPNGYSLLTSSWSVWNAENWWLAE